MPALLDGMTKLRDEAPTLRGIGVAVAGFLNSKRDRLVYNPNLEPLVAFPFCAILAEHSGAKLCWRRIPTQRVWASCTSGAAVDRGGFSA
jgi:hypothetical protein